MKKLNLIFLLTITVLFACTNNSRQENLNSNKTKTIVKSIDSILIIPEIFETSFVDGTEVQQGDFNYAFKKMDLGKIKIESGKLIACDPIVMHDGIAFVQKVPIGDFPVQLAIAKTSNDRRVAFSRILFSEKPVSKWEFALRPGQRPIGLNDSIIHCYGVDAGTGIFIDETSNKSYSRFKDNTWDNVFVNKMDKCNYTGFVHDFGSHNLAVFSTGYGDGCYATYIGYDSNGNVCRMITDFGLIEWWKEK